MRIENGTNLMISDTKRNFMDNLEKTWKGNFPFIFFDKINQQLKCKWCRTYDGRSTFVMYVNEVNLNFVAKTFALHHESAHCNRDV